MVADDRLGLAADVVEGDRRADADLLPDADGAGDGDEVSIVLGLHKGAHSGVDARGSCTGERVGGEEWVCGVGVDDVGRADGDQGPGADLGERRVVDGAVHDHAVEAEVLAPSARHAEADVQNRVLGVDSQVVGVERDTVLNLRRVMIRRIENQDGHPDRALGTIRTRTHEIQARADLPCLGRALIEIPGRFADVRVADGLVVATGVDRVVLTVAQDDDVLLAHHRPVGAGKVDVGEVERLVQGADVLVDAAGVTARRVPRLHEHRIVRRHRDGAAAGRVFRGGPAIARVLVDPSTGLDHGVRGVAERQVTDRTGYRQVLLPSRCRLGERTVQVV